MSKPLAVILNGTCLDVIAAHCEYLDALGIEWRAEPTFRTLRVNEFDAVLAGADAAILPAAIRNLPLPEHMARHTSLKVLSVAASGYEWLDLDAATAAGIVVTHAPVRAGNEVVADLTWGLMLAVARQIPHFDRRVRAGLYDRGMGVSVWGKTLGIVGLGRVGQAVARRAHGFEMRVLATEPRPDRAFVQEQQVELVALDELLLRSDFISLHVRLDASTAGMIGRRELRLMKSTAFLINAARAQLVDEPGLAEAIVAGRLAGAALDDPPLRPNSPLLALPNVVYSPHAGNRALEGVHAVFRCAIDNVVQVLRGSRPQYVLNPEVYARGVRAPLPPTRFEVAPMTPDVRPTADGMPLSQ